MVIRHVGISLWSQKARQGPAMPEPDTRMLRGWGREAIVVSMQWVED